MSRIRSAHTKPELLVRRFLHAQGFRYRLHDKRLPGRPDIVLKKYKTIIDVRGCFWHNHNKCKFDCKADRKSNIWLKRVLPAIKRDKINTPAWKKLGWNVIIIWSECQLEPKKKKSNRRNKSLAQLAKTLHKIDTSN